MDNTNAVRNEKLVAKLLAVLSSVETNTVIGLGAPFLELVITTQRVTTPCPSAVVYTVCPYPRTMPGYGTEERI